MQLFFSLYVGIGWALFPRHEQIELREKQPRRSQIEAYSRAMLSFFLSPPKSWGVIGIIRLISFCYCKIRSLGSVPCRKNLENCHAARGLWHRSLVQDRQVSQQSGASNSPPAGHQAKAQELLVRIDINMATYLICHFRDSRLPFHPRRMNNSTEIKPVHNQFVPTRKATPGESSAKIYVAILCCASRPNDPFGCGGLLQ